MEAEEVAKKAEEFLTAYEKLQETHNSYGLHLKHIALRKALNEWRTREL